MDQTIDPLQTFPEFYTNSIIDHLGQFNKWTVSDYQSRPINIQALRDRGVVYGARQTQLNTDTMTLQEFTEFLPDAANATFFADCIYDGVLIIDIEKTCPPDIALKLFQLPGCLYTEVSKSGLGYHIIVPLPRDDHDLMMKLNMLSVGALRSPAGAFEVLLHHWVTFTRKVVTHDAYQHLSQRAHAEHNKQMTNPPEEGSWLYDLHSIDYSSVASVMNSLINYRDSTAANYTTSSTVDEDILRTVEQLPHYRTIIDELSTIECDYHVDDYDGDHSRFEFALLSWLHNRFYAVATGHNVLHHYDATAQAVVIYAAITRRIPHRDKHDTMRSGMPYLLYSATRCVGA